MEKDDFEMKKEIQFLVKLDEKLVKRFKRQCKKDRISYKNKILEFMETYTKEKNKDKGNV